MGGTAQNWQTEAEIAEQHEPEMPRWFAQQRKDGRALTQIRDQRLYCDPENPRRTFAQYCRGRWDTQRAYAYRQIDAASIMEHLSPIGDILPITERRAGPVRQPGKSVSTSCSGIFGGS